MYLICIQTAFNTNYHDVKELDFDLNSKSMRRGGYGYFTKNQIKQRQSSSLTESGIYTTVVELYSKKKKKKNLLYKKLLTEKKVSKKDQFGHFFYV